MLSKSQFEKAENFIRSHARPIDQALYNLEFNNGSPQMVLDLLKNYQNDDGGFGQALEPDFRTKRSSVLATTVAMQYLNELKLSKPNKIIERAISYLTKSIQQFSMDFPLRYFWYPVPRIINHSSQAPWWIIEKLEPPNIESWPNPSVEVIGYLLQYSDLVLPFLLEEVVIDLNEYLKLVPKLRKSPYYDFLCFKRLLPQISEDLQKQIFIMLENSFRDTELLNTTNLKDVKIQRLVTEKNSFLYRKFPKKIVNLLQNEVDRLFPDGGSHPSWKWGETDLWNKIEKEWAGKLTYELLVTLKYCDLLD